MYNIASLQADCDDNIVSIGWTYTNNGGSRSGTVKLTGSIPASSTTKADLITYVEATLPDGTSEKLDAQIEKDLAAAALDVHNVDVPA